MPNTKLLYLEDFTALRCGAIVVDVVHEDARSVIILDQTVFYPQGGGQPYDRGMIRGPAGTFRVDEVRYVDGVVKHIGVFESGAFQQGEAVTGEVDRARRELHSRIHSAGHVIDMAVHALQLPWVPGKGFHFPEGPYVEYAGNVDDRDKEKVKVDIERLCNAFVAEGRATTLRFMEKERMADVCHFVPDYLPEGKPGRVVMYGDFGIPCGGTHVANLSEIRSIVIRKVKMKSGNMQIAYDVER